MKPDSKIRFLVAALAAIALLAGTGQAQAKKGTAPKKDNPTSAQEILLKADFLVACEKGNAQEVRKLLTSGVSPNSSRSSGASALTYAVAGKHTAVVKILLDAKADPNQTAFGLAPLFMAAESGDLETLRVLLKAGADVNQRLQAIDEDMKVRNGDTALIAAASMGVHAGVARALLAAGANVNAQADNGKTALIQAVASDNVEVVRVPLEAHPNLQLEMKPPEQIDALSLAVGKSNAGIVALLVNAGANVDVLIDGEVSLLEFAILSDQPEAAAILRKAGVKEPTQARLAELKQAATEP